MRPTDDTNAHPTREAAADSRDDTDAARTRLFEAGLSSSDSAAESARRGAATGDGDEDDGEESAEVARGRARGAAPSRVIDALPGSPHLWTTICLACLIVSAALILTGRAEAAFVTATLGVLAWFINVRNGLRGDDDASERGGDDDKKRLRNP